MDLLDLELGRVKLLALDLERAKLLLVVLRDLGFERAELMELLLVEPALLIPDAYELLRVGFMLDREEKLWCLLPPLRRLRKVIKQITHITISIMIARPTMI